MQIDRLNLGGFANLPPWVSQLEERIHTILVGRLTTEILAWCHKFEIAGQEEQQVAHGVSIAAAGGELSDIRSVRPLVYEIRIRNQVLYLEPPLESAKATCLKSLQEIIGIYAFVVAHRVKNKAEMFTLRTGVICNQTRLKSTRYELTLQMQSDGSGDNTYSSLVRNRSPCPSSIE